MKSKRQLKNKYGTKRKFQLPSKHEGLMIIIMLSVVWFAWGQFQFQSECCEGNQCEIKQCGM
jgi:hypothetical protein